MQMGQQIYRGGGSLPHLHAQPREIEFVNAVGFTILHLTELTELVTSVGLLVDCVIRGGIPSDSILACALQQQCDLLYRHQSRPSLFPRLP